MLPRRLLLFFPVLAICATLLAGCGWFRRSAPAPAPAPAASAPAPARGMGATVAPSPPVTGRPVILALGNSLTAGNGVPGEHTYPSQLQAALDQQGLAYEVVNAGLSGDTSAGGLNRVDALLAHYRPALVILELGANDGLRGQGVEQMRKNLDAIIARCQGAGARVVLAGMEAPPNMGPRYTGEFRQVFPDLAQKYGVPLIPFFLEGVGGVAHLNQADGIHPTAEGYAVVTRNVLRVLEPLLKNH